MQNVKPSFAIKCQLEDLTGYDQNVLMRSRVESVFKTVLSTSVDIADIRSFDPVISTTVQGRELRLSLSDTKKTVILYFKFALLWMVSCNRSNTQSITAKSQTLMKIYKLYTGKLIENQIQRLMSWLYEYGWNTFRAEQTYKLMFDGGCNHC